MRETPAVKVRPSTRWLRPSVAMAAIALGLCAQRARPATAATPPISGKIAYEASVNGPPDIYILNADGSSGDAPLRLTSHPNSDQFPNISADGSKVVFASSRNGGQEDIYVANADGSSGENPTRLTFNSASDNTPSFSPDGSKVAFYSTRGGNVDIYVLNTDGSSGDNPTRLTFSSAVDVFPTFSPDGSKIAFVSDRTGGRDIYVLNADGSSGDNPTRLTFNAAEDTQPDFSPDGSKIAFESSRNANTDIYVANADGSSGDSPTRLTTNPAADEHPAFSPDGSRIAFHSNRNNNNDIYVMNADGSSGDSPTRLTFSAAVDRFPSWGPGRVALPANIVTTTADSGPGSLREAINFANANAGTTIRFNISQSGNTFSNGVFTIRLDDALPTIYAAGTIIDGASQSAFSAATGIPLNASGPEIEINGDRAGTSGNGGIGLLLYGARNCLIKALAINGFRSSGVVLNLNATANRIESCYIGTNATGTQAVPNVFGVTIQGGSNANIIGGDNSGGASLLPRNLISGNILYGVYISGSGADGNVVKGNFIGTNIGSDARVPNGGDGVNIENGAKNNVIGGPAPDIISGNNGNGVHITDVGTTGNTVFGNIIGAVGFSGSPLPNSGDGVRVEGGALGNSIRGNLLTANGGLGINLVGGSENASGVTPNDAGDGDTGSNNGQNYPVIDAGVTTDFISGTLNSLPNSTFAIDVYGSDQADPSGFGEGLRQLGSTTIVTDANGNASWSFSGTFGGNAVVAATATNVATGDTSEFSASQVLATASTTGALITELRYRGPNGTEDEYVEILNVTEASLNISGWQLLTNGTLAATVTSNTILAPRAHYLFTNTGYSLGSCAGSDQPLAVALADGATIMLRNAIGADVDVASGLSPTTDAQAAQRAFVRLSLAGQINDTGSASDFLLVSSDGTSGGSAQTTVRGVPGPQSTGSPVARDDAFTVERFDTSVAISNRPNQVRVGAATGPNAPQGTILFRRRIVNTSGLIITRLRFRVQRLTTQGNRSGSQADLRFLTSPSEMRVSTSQGGNVQVYGTLLEPPAIEGTGAQASGGMNASGASKNADDTVTLLLKEPLKPNEARNYGFLFRVIVPGDFSFTLSAEASTASPAGS